MERHSSSSPASHGVMEGRIGLAVTLVVGVVVMVMAQVVGASGVPEGTGECLHDCTGRGICRGGKCYCSDGWVGTDCSRDACWHNCSGHGTCHGSVCVCFPGYTGHDCSRLTCAHSCSGHGICNELTGHCYCVEGYSGDDCSLRSCPNHCMLRGSCEKGICVCNKGWYGEDCSLHTCPNECGGDNHGFCDADTGKCTCLEGWTGEDCTLLACPNGCSDRGICNNGTCYCKPGFTGVDCSVSIRDLEALANQWGQLIASLPTHPIPLRFDPRICGNCSRDHGMCVDGTCHCRTPYVGKDCTVFACADCHGHGKCNSHTLKCECEKGKAGYHCTRKACPGDCNGNGVCVDGTCHCDNGWVGASCGETACAGGCSGHGACVNDACYCEPGWTGQDCSLRSCLNECSYQGLCFNGTCQCDGYRAADCAALQYVEMEDNRMQCMYRCHHDCMEDCQDDAPPLQETLLQFSTERVRRHDVCVPPTG